MANVDYIQAHQDASGAPAVVTHGRFTFAFNTLGEVKMRALKVSGPRLESEEAAARCRKAYLRARAELVDPAWLARNAALYAVL